MPRRPISEAPRDGTVIRLFPKVGEPFRGYYSHVFRGWVTDTRRPMLRTDVVEWEALSET